MTTLRFNPPQGFKREFFGDGTTKATCEYCQGILLGTASIRSAAESQHRLSCTATSQPAAHTAKAKTNEIP